ncbi:nucleotidyltransferase family protein [Chitinophagaceae bacterium MMS25-I14]
MIPELSKNIDAIIAVCKKMQVTSLYLFGSAVHEQDFTAESDLDFLLKYKKDSEGLPVAPFDYFNLLFALEEITGRKIDLLIEDNIKNAFFKECIDKEKVRIYEA